jgi:hypothetical protein
MRCPFATIDRPLTPLSIAPHSVLTTMNSPACCPPLSASLILSSPSLLIVLVLSIYAPFVPVPKIAPIKAGPFWYDLDRSVPTVYQVSSLRVTRARWGDSHHLLEQSSERGCVYGQKRLVEVSPHHVLSRSSLQNLSSMSTVSQRQ